LAAIGPLGIRDAWSPDSYDKERGHIATGARHVWSATRRSGKDRSGPNEGPRRACPLGLGRHSVRVCLPQATILVPWY